MRIRDLVAAYRAHGDLCVVAQEVPREAIPALIQDEERGRNRAVLFERVRGYRMPVVANLYGTRERYAFGINSDAASIADRVHHAIAHPAEAVRVGDAPCFEVVYDEPDVGQIMPIIQYSYLDGGPYITAGVVFMKDPDSGRRNISFIRFQQKGPNKFGFNPKSIHNKGYYQKIALGGRRLEVAVAIGPPSEMLAMATEEIPDEVDEIEVATALADPARRHELAVARCGTVDVDVPAGCEIIIEGVVSTELEPEGPFGDWTGCYARPQMKPTLHVTRVSHRRDAVCQTILPGTSKEQSLFTALRVYPPLEAIRQRYPQITEVAIPEYGLGRLAVVAVREPTGVDSIVRDCLAIQKINRVIVVNADVDLHDPADVLWAVSNRILEPEKVTAERCADEWWNNLKLGIDTTVDVEDIRHKRPRIIRAAVEEPVA